MGKGIGYGKVIFFGEHFTVYGSPVIAFALSLAAEADVGQPESGGWYVLDERQETKGYKEEKKEMQIESLKRIFRYLRFSPEHLTISLSGDCPAMSGIGATGASSVAIVRALSDEFHLKLSDDEINATSYEAEIAYHGKKTVGVDNMVATYGGGIYLIKGTQNIVKRIGLKEPVEIVIGNSGINANTKKMLNGFGERKKRFPEKYDQLIREANEIAEKGMRTIEEFDLEKMGRLLNRNHSLLREAEISCPELDLLVDLCRTEGAMGAKLTGSGGGGIMLALTPGKKLQQRVASVIEAKGFQAIRTVVGERQKGMHN